MARYARTAALVCVVIVAAAAVLAACGDDNDKKDNVVLSEYIVKPDQTSIKAGKITFTADNKGGSTHEMVVVKADDASALPTDTDGAVDEEGLKAGQAQGEVEDVAAGTTKSVELDLTPGRYVVFCNIVEETDGTKISHFKKGMHAIVTVD